MRKLYLRWKAWAETVSRKKRVAGYLLMILLSSLGIYVFIGAPTFSWEHKYRRIEKSFMVGPGEILGYERVTGAFYREVVLAETEEELIISTLSMYDACMDILQFMPKTGKVSVVGVPQDPAHTIALGDFYITVLVADEYPEAVRAEVDLRLFWKQFPEDEPEYPVFHATAQRKKDGYFRLDIPLPKSEESKERQILELYSNWICGYAGTIVPQDTYQATVRFYDDTGNMIVETSLPLANAGCYPSQ